MLWRTSLRRRRRRGWLSMLVAGFTADAPLLCGCEEGGCPACGTASATFLSI